MYIMFSQKWHFLISTDMQGEFWQKLFLETDSKTSRQQSVENWI